MGSLIGVLSTVILVSTVCTLIFAVGAYVISRKNRNGVGTLDETMIPGDDIADPFSRSPAIDATSTTLFKRAQVGAGLAEPPASKMDDEYQWK